MGGRVDDSCVKLSHKGKPHANRGSSSKVSGILPCTYRKVNEKSACAGKRVPGITVGTRDVHHVEDDAAVTAALYEELIPILRNHRAFCDCFVALLLAMTTQLGIIASAAKQPHAALSSRTGISYHGDRIVTAESILQKADRRWAWHWHASFDLAHDGQYDR
jgi:hypothetical protein